MEDIKEEIKVLKAETETIIRRLNLISYFQKKYLLICNDENWKEVFFRYPLCEAKILYKNNVLPEILDEDKKTFCKDNLYLINIINGKFLYFDEIDEGRAS